MGCAMRVLIVEDSALIAFEFAESIRAAGHEPLGPAATAEAAARMAEELKPDIAFVDIKLRDGLSGPQIARLLRSRFGVLPLFITGDEGAALDNQDAAVGLISKPATRPSLTHALEIMVALKEGKSPLEVHPELRLFGRRT
jgi:two-component system, response regulator PdtaR